MTIPPRPLSVRVLPGFLLLLGLVTLVRAAPPVFNPVAETEALLHTMPAAARAKSDAYFEGGYWLLLWNIAGSLGLAWLLLRFGWPQKIRDFSERTFQARFLQGLLFVVLFLLLDSALTLPWDYYEGFLREHQYGLSNLGTGGWLGERAKGLLVSLVVMSPLASLLYLGIRRFTARWWVAAGAATPFLLFFLTVLAPVYVAPLFNHYQYLADPAVLDPILSMARANGVPADHVYQFDASKQTNRISANVSGAFRTIRISLNDNLLSRCTPAEVRAVMGHELGHYVLNHVYKLVIYLSLLYAAAFAFAHWFFGAARRRAGADWGLRGIDDLAGLPLLLAGLGFFLFLATPVRNSIIRTTEAEADIFGLNAAREPDGFATIALKLSEYRKLAPGRWEEIIFFDHPSGYQRILMAMRWKAEYDPEVRLADRPQAKH